MRSYSEAGQSNQKSNMSFENLVNLRAYKPKSLISSNKTYKSLCKYVTNVNWFMTGHEMVTQGYQNLANYRIRETFTHACVWASSLSHMRTGSD